MRALFSIILILTIFSSSILEKIPFLNESELIELVDTDIDNDAEEKKLEIEDKIIVSTDLSLLNSRKNFRFKFFIVNQKKKSTLHREILTPPPELS